MKLKQLATLSTVTLSSILLTACMSSPSNMAHSQQAPEHNIDHNQKMTTSNLVEVAQSNEDFSILVEAVVAAGLVDTLATTPNLTVLAPTNEAFANLLGELGMSKSQLFADKELLTQVLTYHVIPATIYSSQVKPGMVKTVQGSQLTVTSDGKIRDGKGRMAHLVATDVPASNGVIHVIDKVLLP